MGAQKSQTRLLDYTVTTAILLILAPHEMLPEILVVPREKTPWAPQLEENPETPLSSRAEGVLFLHGLESNPGSSLQTEEEAGLP